MRRAAAAAAVAVLCAGSLCVLVAQERTVDGAAAGGECAAAAAARRGTGERAPVLLASFPRSGSTWMRLMLEAATGLCTGSLFEDELLRGLGLACEGATDDVVVVKTHAPIKPKGPRGRVDGYAGAVVLVRDPLDAIVSLFHYSARFRHNETRPLSDFAGDRWAAFVRRAASQYAMFGEFWAARMGEGAMPVLVVRYEDVVRDAAEQVRRIMDFVGVAEPAAGRIRCAVQGQGARRGKRPDAGAQGPAAARFTEEQLAFVGERTRAAREALGYA